MPEVLDLTGQQFGKLTAIKRAENRGSKTYWLCECECGNQKEVQTSHLRSGLIKSCGCLNKNLSKESNCLNCGTSLNKNQFKYCSNKCQLDFQRKEKVKQIFNGEISGLKNATNSSPKIKDNLRLFMLEKSNYCCEKCGCNWINPYSGKTILEIHHIDGNRNNNLENNLQVLCPNCHAMTENYKGLNVKK